MNIEFEGRFGQAQRQKYDCLLFDLDDTLYPIIGYDEYHSFVHGRFPYENLKPDPVLRSLLLNLPIRKVNDPPAGISGAPVDNNIMLWNAVIFGPDDTPWDEGTFKLTLQFSEDYPNKPPTVRFISRMFHPNNVVFPRPEELKARSEKRFGEMGKEVPGEAVNEMLANFDLPKSKDMPRTDDYFDQVLIVGSLHQVDSTAFRIAAIAWHDEFTPLQKPLIVVNTIS
ncbi:hypothetical protein L2E82_18537 [Cichorium intybus]|uniref:Uncharacterized protein n=1 Tax=Cichorium intybus TaxID=13427 RepID=A0ACB9FAD8_CICIN|nr:hypothetical protein L2E82_18537 [Cichorium intybus]